MSINIVNETIKHVIRAGSAALVIAIFVVVVQNRDDTRDLKRELPGVQRDIQELKEQGKNFATKKQLEDAEQRVKNEFAEQLKKQSKTRFVNP